MHESVHEVDLGNGQKIRVIIDPTSRHVAVEGADTVDVTYPFSTGNVGLYATPDDAFHVFTRMRKQGDLVEAHLSRKGPWWSLVELPALVASVHRGSAPDESHIELSAKLPAADDNSLPQKINLARGLVEDAKAHP